MRIDGSSILGIYDAAGQDDVQKKARLAEVAAAAVGAEKTSAKAGKDQDVEVTVSRGQEQKYISQLQDVQDVNLAAITEAKRLIAAGQLDTPEAIHRAADAIVDHGI